MEKNDYKIWKCIYWGKEFAKDREHGGAFLQIPLLINEP